MIVTLKTHGLQTLEQGRAYLAGSAPLSCAAPQRETAYGFIPAQLCQLDDLGPRRPSATPASARLAGLSNGHLYNLRASQTYRQRGPFDKTRPVQLPIGERRKPRPEGRPGFVRIDTVHPGDPGGIAACITSIWSMRSRASRSSARSSASARLS